MPRASSRKPKTTPKRSTELLTPAISYLRVSTAAQTENSKTGISRQEKAFEKWLHEHPDHTDAGAFRDEGISGRRKHRTKGSLSLLLERARLGEFQKGSCLVVESVSRLTRDQPKDALKLLIELFDLGFHMAFTQWGGEVLTDEKHGVWGRLTGAIEAAAVEWEDKSARSQDYWDERREHIAQGNLSAAFQSRRKGKREAYPFWLDFDPKANEGRGRFLHNNHVSLVQRMAALAQEMGTTAVARKLEEEGFRSVDGRTGGKTLTPADVRGVLINPALVGTWQSKGAGNRPVGEPVSGVFPPVLTESEFLALREVMAKRGGQRGAKASTRLTNLFQGVSYCFHCGGLVGARPGNRRPSGGRYHYWRCRRHDADPKSCSVGKSAKRVGVSYKDEELLGELQAYAWESFFGQARNEADIAAARQDLLNAEQAQAEAARLETKRRESFDAYVDAGRVVPERVELLLEEAGQAAIDAQADVNHARSQLQKAKSDSKKKPSAKAFRQKIQAFRETGLQDLEQRQEFNRFLHREGIGVAVIFDDPQWPVWVGDEKRETRLMIIDLRSLVNGESVFDESGRVRLLNKATEDMAWYEANG